MGESDAKKRTNCDEAGGKEAGTGRPQLFRQEVGGDGSQSAEMARVVDGKGEESISSHSADYIYL